MNELIACGTPKAPFCKENGMLDILQTSPSGDTVFTQVLLRTDDGQMVKAPGAYFVIPTECYGPRENMPFDFLHEVNWHLDLFGVEFDNGGFNYTYEGGARVAHAHWWGQKVLKGDAPEGLYTTRRRLRDATVGMEALRADLARTRGSGSGSIVPRQRGGW